MTGVHTLPDRPHFLWVTQFPLFTRADEDKEHLAKGRWSATHHPFTAPMFEDLEDLKQGKVEAVSFGFPGAHCHHHFLVQQIHCLSLSILASMPR